METLVSTVTGLTTAVEKGGVVAVLIIIIVALALDWLRLRKEMTKVYGQRDKALLSVVKLKTTCELKGIVVDLRDIEDMLPKMAAA